MQTYAIVTAAGRGTRFGDATPKQYLPLAGRPLLRWSLETLARTPGIAGVLTVVDPGHRALYDEATAGLDLLPPVAGGATRQASVAAGLEALAGHLPDAVLIHDGARPCLSPALIARLVAALAEAPAVVPTLPVTDTLRRFTDGISAGDVPRAGLHRVQTPQAFDYRTILAAHRRQVGAEATDDAALVMAEGGRVMRVAGEERNIKVTTPEDMTEAARHLAPTARRWATGLGFDVHRLVAGRPLILLGLELPSPLGLAGHSDADVGLHAVTDAILGALGEGDIGQHFPPSEARWRDASSAIFARHATSLAAVAGATVEHVDVTIIGERPKIGPHRERLRAKLAEILAIPVERTGVKATTTEQLGFTGRGEGLAAQAVATLAFWR